MKPTLPKFWAWLLCMFLTHSVNGQEQRISPVAKEVLTEAYKKYSVTIDLFERDPLSNPKSSGFVLNIEESNLKKILTSKNHFFQIPVQLPNGDIRMVQVIETTLLSSNHPHNSSNQPVKRKYLRGIFEGDPNSLVTLNLGSSGISGILSDSSGNYVIQPINKNQSQIDRESNSQNEISRDCHTSYELSQLTLPDPSIAEYKSEVGIDTVRLYFECDYDMYLINNQSISETEDYLLGLFNEVAALYANESICLLIEDHKIWDMPDPYSDQNAIDALNSFNNHLGSNFNGQVAQLLSGSANNNGGLAVINSICNKENAHSYSNIEGYFNPISSYSWDVHVVAHELGHNFGSPHTHDCVWGPDQNSALDNCAVGGSCDLGPEPLEGGTIMSYCHSTNYGVNFSLGFGMEPGDLIRSIVGSCPSDNGFICSEAIALTGSGSYFATGPSHGNGATHGPADHANWFVFNAPSSGTISIGSCDQPVDTRLYVYSGSCDDLLEIASSDDDCSSGNGFNYSSEVRDLEASEGVTYYFEWDDRWSADPFEFSFEFSSDESDCNNLSEMESPVAAHGDYHMNEEISFGVLISPNVDLSVSSDSSISIMPGFETSISSSFTARIESCEEYLDRINN